MRSFSRLTSRLSGPILALAVLVLAAAVFRLCDLAARNFWTDEAWVALAALKPTPAAALAAAQSTPPLYLLALWALTQATGGGEAVLRSLSVAFGLGTVLLFWPLARRLAPGPAAWLGLAAVAASPILVYFSKELKQYSGDAFFAVLVLLLTERLRETQGRRGWLALAGAGALGLGFSHPLIFLLPVAMAALWLDLPPVCRRRLLTLALGWGAAFAFFYLLFIRRQMDPALVSYWSQDFPDISGVGAFGLWLAGALARYFDYFLGPWGIYWGPPAVLAGLWFWVREGRSQALLYLGGPLLLALGAAALHRYPFMANYAGNRLMLFSAPLLYLAAATGLSAALAWCWARQRWLAAALGSLVLLSLQPLEVVRQNLFTSNFRSQLKPLVALLEGELKPKDRIYVYYYAVSPFKYYYQGDWDRVAWGKSCVEKGFSFDDDEEDEEEPPTPARVWVVGGHFPDLAYMENFCTGLLGGNWRAAARFTDVGVVLYRFERQPRALAKTPAPPPEPALSASEARTPGKAYE